MELWEKFHARIPHPKILRCTQGDLPWKNVYAICFNPKSSDHLPVDGRDWTAFRYFKLRNNLEFHILELISRDQIGGDAVIGLTPLSWRQPTFVAHAMVEALANVFYGVQLASQLNTLSVVFRSLDFPEEVLQVFDRNYFRAYRRRLGWFPEVCDAWFPG